MDIKQRFGRSVRAKRQTLQLSQEGLALRIGADQAYVSRVEAGQINVSLETAQAIAEALTCSLSDLVH